MKESLSSKQARFTFMVAQLIDHANKLGYRLTFGDAYATDGHSKNSFHYKRLAVDFNLFKQDDNGIWRFCRSTLAHKPLGTFWKSIGGTWGGDFKRKDGNHYSLGE